MKTYKNRKHKSSTPIDFRGTVYRGKAAKKVRKSLAPALAHWERGIGNMNNPPRQKPGSTKI